MISVLVADDQALIRSLVTQLLASEPDITIAGQAEDGERAVELARRLRPDLILMDIIMPVVDGIAATAEICSDPELAHTRVLILTTFEEDEYVLAALRAGASGFIGKSAEPDEILHAIRAVHAGEALLSPAATRALISRYVRATPSTPPPSETVPAVPLTPRETEILQLVAQGLSNDAIAFELFISPHTAKTHVKRIMTKLGAHDRAQCVIYAYESGLLVPGWGGIPPGP